MKKRILVVDDEQHIVEFLEMNLRQHGYEPIHAMDGASAISMAKQMLPDCILLDLMLPNINGIETCRRIKQDSATASIPIIMLTAKSEENDKVIGLGVGADDYVTKPFGLRELFARIEVVLRRANDALLPRTIPDHVISFQGVTIDMRAYEVKHGDERIELTKTEFELLRMLAVHVDMVVSREELLRHLDVSMEAAGRSLDVHMRNLRKKLNQTCDDGITIETIRGIGFKLIS